MGGGVGRIGGTCLVFPASQRPRPWAGGLRVYPPLSGGRNSGGVGDSPPHHLQIDTVPFSPLG